MTELRGNALKRLGRISRKKLPKVFTGDLLEDRRMKDYVGIVRKGCIALLIALCSLTANGTVITIANSQDTFVNSGDPNRNFGTANRLRVGGSVDPETLPLTPPTPPGERIGLSFFDVSSLAPGSSITGVTFSAFSTDSIVLSGGFNVYGVTSSWTELSVTWNTRPTLGTLLFNTGMLPSMGLYSIVDNAQLISLAQNWVNNPSTNFGIAYRLANQGHNHGDTFGSRERSGRPAPTLNIAFTPAVPEPATLALMGLGLAGIGYRRHRSKIAA